MALVAVHHELDEIFALARELILVGAGPEASAVLGVYRALTALHAADEEAALLPLLDPTARWPDELYLGQHRKMLAGLDRLVPVVADLRRDRPGWRRAALAALDLAAPIHHLVAHHHLAEEQELFPTAAAAAPGRLEALAAAWQLERAQHQPALDAARRALG